MSVKWLTCAVALLAVVPAPASASFPGRNGDLAVASPVGEVRHVVEIDVRTGDRDWLTQPVRSLREGRETFAPEYFPDGRRLLFIRRAPDNSWSVWSADDEGGDAILHADSLDAWRRMNAPGPGLSPTGTRIVYSRFGGVFTARLDGSDERVVRREPRCIRPDGSTDLPECDAAMDPTWSPDGRWMTVMRTGGAIRGASYGLWLIDASDGRLVRRLASDGHGVDWSPDSRRIAFASTGGGGRAFGNIYSLGADGGDRQRHTRARRANDIAPVWSPDGKWIAWIRMRPGPGAYGEPHSLSVWRRRVAGGPAQHIAKLPELHSDAGVANLPTLSWQPRPRR